jgi:hypothetical protein
MIASDQSPTDTNALSTSETQIGTNTSFCPVWTLNVHAENQLVRWTTVLAPSSFAALEKGREQLDDGERLSVRFAAPENQTQTSGAH